MEIQFKRTPVSPVPKLELHPRKSRVDFWHLSRKKEKKRGREGFKKWILTPFPVKGSVRRGCWDKGWTSVPGLKSDSWAAAASPLPWRKGRQLISSALQGWVGFKRGGREGGVGLVRVQSHHRCSSDCFPCRWASASHHLVHTSPHFTRACATFILFTQFFGVFGQL